MKGSHKLRVLVTGPDGFVGTDVCGALLKRGYLVCGAQWRAGSLPDGCISVVVGDVNSGTKWETALNDVDTIVHLAARVHVMSDRSDDPMSAFREVNVEGTRRLAECAAVEGVKHFLFVSSIKVNGESTSQKPFSEKDIPKPEDPYGLSKWEAEQLLREIEGSTDMSVTILRPPLLYGPGVKANFLRLIKLVDKGIPLPLDSIDNKRSLLGLGNLADLICHCIERPVAEGATFVVSDGHDFSTADIVRKIGISLDKKPHLLSLNSNVLCMLGRICGKYDLVKRLTESLQIDSTKVRSVLDWKPPFSIEEELARTAEWYRDLQKS